MRLSSKSTTNELYHIDPLSYAIAPAVNESLEDREARLEAEEQAKKLSDEIDKFLKKSANNGDTDGHRKKTMAVKVLLLGQSESGKSTALKNFQLLYNPQSFQAERAAWRMVILFNLVQSIRVLHTIISDAIQAQQKDEADTLQKSPASPIFGRPPLPDFQDLFPPQPQQLHRKRSSGPELTNGRVPLANGEQDATDAASTHSTTTSGSSTKNPNTQQPTRRSSFFGSKESKSKDKENKKTRSRPSTATTPMSSPISVTTPTTQMTAFCLPTQTFGSSRRGSNPSAQGLSPVQAHSRRPGSDESNVPMNGSRGAITSSNSSPTSDSTRQKGPLSLSIPPSSPSGTSRRQPSPARSTSSTTISQRAVYSNFTAQHQLFLMRLKPLLTVELALLRRLSLPEENDWLVEENENTSTVTGFEAPARMSATAARGGPILGPVEREAVKLDFNLVGMHNAAVNAAKEGIFGFSAPSFVSLTSSKGTSSNSTITAISKTTSFPGRPRARSSADITGGAISDGGGPGMNGGNRMTYRPSPSASTLSPTSNGANGNIGWKQGFMLHPSVSSSSLELGTPHSSGLSPAPATDVSVPEFFVRSSTNWKEKLKKWKRYDPGVTIGLDSAKSKSNQSSEWNPWDEDDDPAHFIQACAKDLKALWNDPAVRQYLSRNRYKLEHLPGFFLSDVDRIVSRDYTPTDDDILRARLKTIGAVEHKFTVNTKGSNGRDWLVYDVGGARTQRAAWVPYFDTVDAIIFIVSLSSFDQTLSEEPMTNRMEDSLRLFRDLVSSPILKNVNIILFLNKYDLLESKLNSGVQLARYFRRYGDRPNTAEAVTKYFRAKFSAIYDKFTPKQARRAFNIHATSLTDPQATKDILEAVNESILEMHIAKTVS